MRSRRDAIMALGAGPLGIQYISLWPLPGGTTVPMMYVQPWEQLGIAEVLLPITEVMDGAEEGVVGELTRTGLRVNTTRWKDIYPQGPANQE